MNGFTTPVYPFSAIVGQEELKRALLLAAVDPGIGGVLIMGHRGTAKSTAVRALAQLLPTTGTNGLFAEMRLEDQVVHFPLFSAAAGQHMCAPVVDLPLSATEDRVVGSLDIEVALKKGEKAFQPGLLARAHGGFLYIDEVNLLEDHLVDLLLDVAASGVNIVEREGFSVRHPARFVLVGSGNPEEGDLRPQLLDRFGLYTQVETITDVRLRMELVRRNEAFLQDPEAFVEQWAPAQQQLKETIARAREHLEQVVMPDRVLKRIVELCLRVNIDGHRGEMTLSRAARALAALEGRQRVRTNDVRQVAVMALRHRLRRDPLEDIDSGEKIRQAMEGLLVGR